LVVPLTLRRWRFPSPRYIRPAELVRLVSHLEWTGLQVRVGDCSAPTEYDPARRSLLCSWCGRIGVVTRVVHVPYFVEQDEDGVWCASAQLRPGVGAVGDGPTAEAAIADLRDALEALLAEVGPPDELTLTLDVA
jgi:predicted RNase H-like HicB family nuclease